MKVEEALNLLKREGYKYTDKRRDMLYFFSSEDRYRTAKDLIEFMEPNYEGISFDTIYRNLHMFNEIGILEATDLNGEKHFRMKCHHHHHHHFICSECGVTKEIRSCPMDNIQEELLNFAIEDHKFEIYGRCPECQQL
ncbi:Fur family transcriptional regulator [Radiobacillus sp. PE A8.2]|uniref:Fur family transcriptional regulator n=1 Tax=Radiobacillus sp. PE A8.2 TaxID=3380349 RepID=UPI0038910B6E